MTNSNIEDPSAALAEFLKECEWRAMVPPFNFVSVDRSGSVLALRATGDGAWHS